MLYSIKPMLYVESFCAVDFHIITVAVLNFNRADIFNINVFEAVAQGACGNCQWLFDVTSLT